jgi:hypothetical protein
VGPSNKYFIIPLTARQLYILLFGGGVLLERSPSYYSPKNQTTHQQQES